jgi:hypothetical protein
MTPPSLRALTAELRALHAAWAHPDAGGEYVGITAEGGMLEAYEGQRLIGREWIPGDGKPFDAVAAARRLLAAVRDAGGGT